MRSASRTFLKQLVEAYTLKRNSTTFRNRITCETGVVCVQTFGGRPASRFRSATFVRLRVSRPLSRREPLQQPQAVPPMSTLAVAVPSEPVAVFSAPTQIRTCTRRVYAAGGGDASKNNAGSCHQLRRSVETISEMFDALLVPPCGYGPRSVRKRTFVSSGMRARPDEKRIETVL